MSVQIPDVIFIDNQQFKVAGEPLSEFILDNGISLNALCDEFNTWLVSCCVRGYIATWKIEENKLFLLDVNTNDSISNIHDKQIFNTLFPNQSKVMANWYSGSLKVGIGEIVNYKNGFNSDYENELHYTFYNGLIIKREFISNTHQEDWQVLNNNDKMPF